MSREDTRMKLIEHGARLVHTKGYHATGIQEIVEAAGVPKGSFYFYFKSKKDFGLALIDYFRGHFVGLAETHRADGTRPALVRLKALFDEFLGFFEAQGAKLGCPIGNLASELGDVDEDFRQRLKAVYAEMQGAVRRFLIEAQQRGELGTDLDPDGLAAFVVSSWEGALVVMKLSGDTSPLRLFDRMIFGWLQDKRPFG